jgi:hypothetical protein
MNWEKRLADCIDWSQADLAAVPERVQAAPPRERLATVVSALRRHDTHYFGFSPGYLAALQRTATPADREAARARLDKALQGDLLFPPHTNVFAALGEETLWLAVDPDRAAAISRKVLEREADWGGNVWCFGITHGIADLLRILCPNPAVADADLLPLFGWLQGSVEAEWKSAGSWDESVLGSSGHNWFIHSYLGFYMAGALFPHFRPFQPFAALAPTYLEREVNLLFAEDGWSREGAAGYHAFAARNVIFFARLAERHGVRFSPDFHVRLRRVADTFWRMLGPDGDYPLFGDASPGNGLDLLRRAGARFGLPHAKGVVSALAPGRAYSGLLGDGGDDLSEAWDTLEAELPPLDSALPASGLYAMRTDWSPAADWCAINAMPVGSIGSSHKHVDIFNLEIAIRGRRVLVDNWYGDLTLDDGSYQQAPEIRNNPMKRRWRVGSSAHNVATVDDQDQVPVVSIYRYGRQETPLVESFTGDARFAWFSGVHEAYRGLPEPVSAHRRCLFWLRGRYWLLLDRFTFSGDKPRRLQQHFHLLNGTGQGAGPFRTNGPGGNLLIVPIHGLTGEARLEPCPYPISTYQNPAHLQIELSSVKNTIMGTLLVPFEGESVPSASAAAIPVGCGGRELDPWEGTGIRVRLNGGEDVFVKLHMQWNLPWQCAGHSGSGRLFHSQLGDLREASPE